MLVNFGANDRQSYFNAVEKCSEFNKKAFIELPKWHLH